MRMTQWKPSVIIVRTSGKIWGTFGLEPTQLVMALKRLISQYSATERLAEQLALQVISLSKDQNQIADAQDALKFINKCKYGSDVGAE